MKRTLAMLLTLLLTALSTARAEPCAEAPLAAALEALKDAGRLHNCEIEVVSREMPDGERIYLLLAADRLPTAGAARPPVSYELRIDRACDPRIRDARISSRVLQHSYGYRATGADYRIALSLVIGRDRHPRELLLQNINLHTGAVDARVDCRSEPEEL